MALKYITDAPSSPTSTALVTSDASSQPWWRGNPATQLPPPGRETQYSPYHFFARSVLGFLASNNFFGGFGWMDLAVWKCVKYRKVAPDLRTYWVLLEALRLDKPDMNGSYDTSHATRWGMILESSTALQSKPEWRCVGLSYRTTASTSFLKTCSKSIENLRKWYFMLNLQTQTNCFEQKNHWDCHIFAIHDHVSPHHRSHPYIHPYIHTGVSENYGYHPNHHPF